MGIRPWWLWGLGLIGAALVVLLAVIAYALLSDEDGESADQVAEPTAAATQASLPTRTSGQTPESGAENPFEPCDVEEAVLRGLAAACVYEFDAQACLTLEWADYVIEDSCPERPLETWPTQRCGEGLQRLDFLEGKCREQLGGQEQASECVIADSLRVLIPAHCPQ
jgi:hypothetical protein